MLTITLPSELADMPVVLRQLLEAELAAGNSIVEVGHSFPAPPAGAYVKLGQPLLTAAPNRGEGISYYKRNSSSYSGEITDARRFYFLLEPALAVEPDERPAGRATEMRSDKTAVSQTPMSCFEQSMVMNYEKWHEGIGYDLDALRAMSVAEKGLIERKLIQRGLLDWRDVEALACLDTPVAHAALKAAVESPNHEVRNAVASYAPQLVSESARIASLIEGLDHAVLYSGLSQTLDQVARFHPPLIVEALLRGTLSRTGEVAVHFAAMLFYIHGQAEVPFDMEQRPFFLRFNTSNQGERQDLFCELCQKIKVDASAFFRTPQSPEVIFSGALASVDHTVTVDVRGEMLTYCEPNRSAHVICTFGSGPCILPRTLSGWCYPLGRRSEKMSDREKQVVLRRIADYCRVHHGMANLTFET